MLVGHLLFDASEGEEVWCCNGPLNQLGPERRGVYVIARTAGSSRPINRTPGNSGVTCRPAAVVGVAVPGGPLRRDPGASIGM